MKRLFDLFISAIGLLLLSPVFILIAIIIFVEDGLPILYVQERVGINGKLFNLYKFRSMYREADRFSYTTFKDDERIFKAGKVLRKYKIDELAQLFNVLKGDMSVVGPRPTVLEDYQKMTIGQKKRFDILPGLTGLAQVSGNTALKWPDRIRFDLEYIAKRNFLYDCGIIFQTVILILSNKIETNTNNDGEW